MGLEEKFGDTLGGVPYLQSGLLAPQTVSGSCRLYSCSGLCNIFTIILTSTPTPAFFVQLHVTSNIFDTFMGGSGGASPVLMPSSCPANMKDEHSMLNPSEGENGGVITGLF